MMLDDPMYELECPVDSPSFPIVEELESGRWVAWYPEQGVRFEGETRDEAWSQLPARTVIPSRSVERVGIEWVATIVELGVEARGQTEAEADTRLTHKLRASVRSDSAFVTRYIRLVQNPPASWRVVFEPKEEVRARVQLEAQFTGAAPLTIQTGEAEIPEEG